MKYFVTMFFFLFYVKLTLKKDNVRRYSLFKIVQKLALTWDKSSLIGCFFNLKEKDRDN